MKKISILLLVFSLLFTACSNTVSREDTTLIPFTSQNGYEITYPDTLSPVSLSSDIDFVVMDDNTGSSVTVMTENTEDAGDITEKSFCDGKLSDGMDIKITSFEQKEINGYLRFLITSFSSSATSAYMAAASTQRINTALITRSSLNT